MAPNIRNTQRQRLRKHCNYETDRQCANSFIRHCLASVTLPNNALRQMEQSRGLILPLILSTMLRLLDNLYSLFSPYTAKELSRSSYKVSSFEHTRPFHCSLPQLKPATSLLSLPVELQTEILYYIGLEDVLHVRQVRALSCTSAVNSDHSRCAECFHPRRGSARSGCQFCATHHHRWTSTRTW